MRDYNVKVLHSYNSSKDVTTIVVSSPYNGDWHTSKREVERHGPVELLFYGPDASHLEAVEIKMDGYHAMSTEVI